MTYDEAVDMWASFRTAMNEVRPGTVKTGKRNAKHLSPYIGGKQLDDIKTIDVENALIMLKGKDTRLGAPMSNATVRKIHGAGMKCFQWAIDRELCSTARNPFKKASKPKVGKSVKPNALQPEDAKRLSQLSKSTLECNMEAPIATSLRRIYETAICAATLIALGTGMRRGEVCALDWENVGDRNIAVVKALKNEGTIEEPKNNTSRRNVAIGRELHEILDEYRAWQERTGIFTAIDGGHPVLMLDGKRMTGNIFEHHWNEFRKAAGFPGLRFHDLRHTHATMLIAAGVDVKTVQMRMGHSSAVMTLDVYAHAVPRNDADAASEISGELFA